jgi:hypothetical protein
MLTSKSLVVFVDDLCSRLVTKRTQQDQEKMNNRYREFFETVGCMMRFSSEIYTTKFSTDVFPLLLRVGQRVPFSEFKRCLPKNKRNNLDNLTLDEVLHLLLELLLLEQVKEKCNLLLVGHFSQAIVVCHRKISQNPLSAIAVPRLNSRKEIDEYMRKCVMY